MPHRNGASRRYTEGSQGPRARWAGLHSSIWMIVWCTRRSWNSICEVLEIFRRRQLCAKSSKREFGRQGLCFLGHRLSAELVSVNPRKVQSIVEWATPTSCCEVRRFTGLANYYRQIVEGYAEVGVARPPDLVRQVRRTYCQLRHPR